MPTYLAAAEVRQMLSTIDDLTKQARQIEEGIEHVRAISRPSQVKSPTAWNYLWARKETVAWAKAAQRAKEAARKAEESTRKYFAEYEPIAARLRTDAESARHEVASKLDTLVETAYRAEVSRVAAEQRRLAATRVTRFRFYSKAFHVECSAAEYAEWSTTQLSAPVWITTFDVKRWWWYLDRFWLDSEGLEAGPRLGLVLEEVESCAGPRIRSIHITGWA